MTSRYNKLKNSIIINVCRHRRHKTNHKNNCLRLKKPLNESVFISLRLKLLSQTIVIHLRHSH